MPSLRQWLKKGPYTLALSSGFFGFFAHVGVLLALEENGLAPSEVSGASAGALAGGCWAAGCSAESLRRLLFELKRQDFWDPSFGFGLLKGERFRTFVAKVTPVSAIEECRVPLKISVFDLYTRSTHVLERGSLSEGIYASCAVPLLFHPIKINKGLYLDGSIKDRPGLSGISDNTRVLYHHILTRRMAGCLIKLSRPMPRRHMMTVVVQQLQPVNPFRLEYGKRALLQAHQAMRHALEKPIDGQLIHV